MALPKYIQTTLERKWLLFCNLWLTFEFLQVYSSLLTISLWIMFSMAASKSSKSLNLKVREKGQMIVQCNLISSLS